MIRHIFPSKEISEWCTNINKLLYVDENVCECAIENIIQKCPTSQQQDLVNGLFWSLWIDQVFYYITYDGGVRPYLRYSFKGTNTDLYQEFRTTYPFPKIHAHSGGGQMSPMTLFHNQFSYNKPTNKQEEIYNNAISLFDQCGSNIKLRLIGIFLNIKSQ